MLWKTAPGAQAFALASLTALLSIGCQPPTLRDGGPNDVPADMSVKIRYDSVTHIAEPEGLAVVAETRLKSGFNIKEWNRITVLVEGSTYRMFVNNTPQLSWTHPDSKHGRGVISLRFSKCLGDVRNLKVYRIEP